MKNVRVAAGLIQREGGEVLAVQRGYGSMAGMWEFPGGKIENGETPEEACRRELLEELQVRVTNLQDFYTLEYDYPDFHLSMNCFFCQIAEDEGEPQGNDRQRELRWVPQVSLATLEWMPADIELVELLEQLARKSNGEGARQPKTSDEVGKEHEGRTRASKKRARKKRAPKKPDLLDGIDTSQLTAGQTALVRRRAAVRKSMQGNKRRDTKPELLVRQRLRAAGLTGYRLDWAKAPGRPDIAFPGRKIAIFVNGCYWHRCPNCNPSVPKKNVEFWEAKFRRNVERDQRALDELKALGWTAITIWECELKRDRIDETMERVIERVRAASTGASTDKAAAESQTAPIASNAPAEPNASPTPDAASILTDAPIHDPSPTK